MYCSVPQIRPPPFAILALVQNAWGAYTRDATIPLPITPSLPVKHDLIVGGGWGPTAIALNYSEENIRNDVRQKILYEKSQFDSLVWGSLTLAPIIVDSPMD